MYFSAIYCIDKFGRERLRVSVRDKYVLYFYTSSMYWRFVLQELCKVALRTWKCDRDFTASERCCEVLRCIPKSPSKWLTTNQSTAPPQQVPEAQDDAAAQDRHGGTQMVQAPMHRTPSTWGWGKAKYQALDCGSSCCLAASRAVYFSEKRPVFRM